MVNREELNKSYSSFYNKHN